MFVFRLSNCGTVKFSNISAKSIPFFSFLKKEIADQTVTRYGTPNIYIPTIPSMFVVKWEFSNPYVLTLCLLNVLLILHLIAIDDTKALYHATHCDLSSGIHHKMIRFVLVYHTAMFEGVIRSYQQC